MMEGGKLPVNNALCKLSSSSELINPIELGMEEVSFTPPKSTYRTLVSRPI